MNEELPKRIKDRPIRPQPQPLNDTSSGLWIPSKKTPNDNSKGTLSTLGYAIILSTGILLMGGLIYFVLAISSFYGY